MTTLYVQVNPWQGPDKISQTRGGENIQPDQFRVGDKVIIKTPLGNDLGIIVKIKKGESEEGKKKENFIVRLAKKDDLQKYKQKNEKRKESLHICEQLTREKNLSMKIVDALYSFDGGRVTFFFIAPRRVDFRDLVQELAGRLHKTVRMHQIGARQEAKLKGDIGPCGRPLCCKKFLNHLGNVTTDFIFDQQLIQRGAERLTGICGRLKCCLAYEEEKYKKMAEKLPAEGEVIRTKKGRGEVIGRHILAQRVLIKTKKDGKIEVEADEIIKKDNKGK